MWTIKQFEAVYDRFQSSDLSVRDFCLNECITESKFYYWKRKLQQHNHSRERQSDFIPIVFTDANQQLQTKKRVLQKQNPEHMHPSEGNAFEIVYPNGVKLRIPEGVDLSQIRSLILVTQ